MTHFKFVHMGRVAGFAAAVLILCAAVCAHAAGVKVEKLTGKVEMKVTETAAWKSVSAGQELAVGAAMRTGADSSCILKWPQGHAVNVRPLSSLVISQTAPGKNSTEIKKGRITARVKKLDRDETFSIKTPTVIAGVRGTDFFVDIAEDGAEQMGVTQGEIFVQIGEEVFTVVENVMLMIDDMGDLTENMQIPEELKQEIQENVAEIIEQLEVEQPDTDGAAPDEAAAEETVDAVVNQVIEIMETVIEEQIVTDIVNESMGAGEGCVHFDIYVPQ